MSGDELGVVPGERNAFAGSSVVFLPGVWFGSCSLQTSHFFVQAFALESSSSQTSDLFVQVFALISLQTSRLFVQVFALWTSLQTSHLFMQVFAFELLSAQTPHQCFSTFSDRTCLCNACVSFFVIGRIGTRVWSCKVIVTSSQVQALYVLLFFRVDVRESSSFLARIACPLPCHFCDSLLWQ
jgi:hypothetical protein